jgi:hypothetical protein
LRGSIKGREKEKEEKSCSRRREGEEEEKKERRGSLDQRRKDLEALYWCQSR